MNTNQTAAFIKARSRRLVEQARRDPETCRMVRGYLNRVFFYGLRNRDLDLMNFATELENSILSSGVAA